jgi:hypothetical protein
MAGLEEVQYRPARHGRLSGLIVTSVNRDRALGELPVAHAVALRLQAAGVGEQVPGGYL